jgi:heat shock protein HtpX
MYKAIAANKRNTVIIIGLFVALLTAIAVWWGNYSGNGSSAILIVGFVLLYTLFQYFMAGSLAVAMSGAIQIEKSDNPRLWNTVENLAITEGMPMPKVYVINDPAPNAFATGRDPKHAIVAATTGLLEIMDDNELQGVMAHEMSHVKNYDIRVSTIVFGLVSAIGILADMAMRAAFWSGMFGGGGRDRDRNGGGDNNGIGLVLILIGIVASIIAFLIGPLVQAAVSRQREYLADASGAEITRFPEGLASALEKLGQYGRPMRKHSTSMAHMYIADPIKPGFVERAFSTHPPIPERIARLKKIGSGF